MARDLDLTARVRLEGGDRVESQLGDIADAAKEAEQEHVVRFRGDTAQVASDVDDVLTKVDKLSGQSRMLLLDSNAAQMQGEIADLLVDIDKLDATDPSIDIKAQNITDLEGGLDRLKAKALEISDTPIEPGRGTDPGAGFQKIVTGADQANSAVANMVGNAAQDMGELGGITGSAGVAVGQLSEYFTDAAFKARDAGQGLGQIFKSFAGAAGPIAAAGIAIQVISAAMEQIGKIKAFRSEDAEAWAKAIKNADDAVTQVADHLSEIGKVQVTTRGVFGSDWQASIEDVTSQIDKAGLTYEDFVNLVNEENLHPGAIDAWAKEMTDKMGGTYYQIEAVQDAAHQKTKQFAEGQKQAAEQTRLNSLSVEGATRATQEYLKVNDSVDQIPDTWAKVADAVGRVNEGLPVTQEQTDAINRIMAETGMTQQQVLQEGSQLWQDQQQAAQEAAKAAQEYAQVLASSDWGASTVAAAATGFGKIAEAQFGLTSIAAANQAAYDNLNDSIKQNGFTFDVATEKGRANAQVVQELYSSLIPELSAAFADAGGNIDKFAGNMDALRANVFTQLSQQTGLTKDQINAVIDQLGVFDGSTYSSTFEMLGVEDANAKLALLSGVITSLPPDVQQRVTMDVIAGDPQAALGEIQAWASGNPATVQVNADPTQAQAATAGLVTGINSLTGMMNVGANTAPAAADAQGAAATISGTKADVTVGANTSPARNDTAALKGVAAGLNPEVSVTAQVNRAIQEIMALRILAALLAPQITVTANTGPAEAGLHSVASQRPQVPVTAYLASAPSAGSIAGAIGTVRVPVDAYLRSQPRITGTL